MPRVESKSSIVRIILRCVRRQRIFTILIPVALLFIFYSSYFNIKAKKLFEDTNSIFIFADREGNKDDLKRGFDSFKRAMLTVGTHYLFSQVSAYLIGYCSILVFKSFLTESLLHSINLEYTLFHSKGTSLIQDNITRSSKAARDLFPIIFFEFTWASIDVYFSVIEIFALLNTEYFLKLFSFIFVGATVAFLVAVFAYRSDRRILGLFTSSLDPLSDTLNNFDVVKSYNKETYEVERYKSSLMPFENASTQFYFILNILKFLQKSFLLLPNVIIYYYVSQEKPVWRNTNTTALSITKYNNLFSSLRKNIVTFRDQIFYYSKYVAQINVESSLFSSAVAPVKKDEVDKQTLDVAISLENVCLYAGNNMIQKNQSFRILKNEKVAITGTNGAGKSVFMKTLLKFFKNEGKFYIDDVLLQNASNKSIRELISYVPQDPHIFNNTVMYNLAYSQKKVDEQKIFKICEAFGLHEFFKSLKDGYHTIAGEKGKYLSGGQKQRISFMRGIIKNAPILLMDEPTANIDKKTEIELVDKVLENCQDRTFILIVHNLELLHKFDKIIHFEKTGITCFDSYEAYKNRAN